MRLALAIAFLAFTQERQQILTFSAPDGAKEEDLSRAAKALQARASALGYIGVLAKPTSQGKVQIWCENGFNEAMRHRVEDLAFIKGQNPEIRFKHGLSGALLEQFGDRNSPVGESKILASNAPPGMRWKVVLADRQQHTLLSDHLKSTQGLLVCDSPAYSKADFVKQTKAGIQYEVSAEFFKRFIDFKTSLMQKGIGDCGIVLLDGDYFVGNVTNLDAPINGRSKIVLTDYVRLAIENPLPFSMLLERK